MSNVPHVNAIYAAFRRGDLPAILERLAEDVDWEYGGGSTDVPWLQRRRGRAAAMKFFEALGGLEFHRLEFSRVIDGGDMVVALVQLEATVKATGKRVAEEDEVHVWHFDPAGRVARFRHRADTHHHWLAYHGR